MFLNIIMIYVGEICIQQGAVARRQRTGDKNVKLKIENRKLVNSLQFIGVRRHGTEYSRQSINI
ncbi:hypothetical protein [Caloranaerobacter ferrireducens]|uniref:hypothetical protein n=1 Tax=Caloranaerobacter ferrireducens TaxID=1323370 RepID=UPI00159F269D|nr:hypothetical protein [Caloranaerobacter ferrireducens]